VELVSAINPALMAHLDWTILHRSASIRERTPDDLAGVDTHPFGFAARDVVATLSRARGHMLTAEFGTHSGKPSTMQTDQGRCQVELMSRPHRRRMDYGITGMEAR
jgi:hypothetical protein